MSSFQPKIIGRVTRPTLQMAPGVPIYVKILTAIEDSKQVQKPAKPGEQVRAPAKVMNVLDLADIGPDGKCIEKTVVCNKVLVSDLGVYEGGYLNKCFGITKSKEKKKGDAGEYYRFDIVVIEDPTAAAPKK